MAQKVTGNTPAAGVTLQAPPMNQPGKSGMVPFRTATTRKVEMGSQDTSTMTAAQQLLTRVLEGTGYLESIDIDVSAVTAANVNGGTAYTADAPWNMLQNVSFKAIGPDLITLTGYSLYLVNKYGGFGVNTALQGPGFLSADPLVYVLTAGANNGTVVHFTLKVPLGINPRNLIGLMGNQDSGTKYQLTTDLAPLATLYGANLPTNAPVVTLQRYLNYCSVPAAIDASGAAQQQVPPTYGVLHMINELRSEGVPVAGATVNHFLRSLGNTDRLFILVFRDSTGARSDLMLPTRIAWRIGADVLYTETSAHRRKTMWDRYGFDSPAGVLVYDFISDFASQVGSGFELGDDWLNSSNVPNAQIECTYPAVGVFANTPGSLTVITDQLVIPPSLDVKSFV
jgi:hypothetical protein